MTSLRFLTSLNMNTLPRTLRILHSLSQPTNQQRRIRQRQRPTTTRTQHINGPRRFLRLSHRRQQLTQRMFRTTHRSAQGSRQSQHLHIRRHALTIVRLHRRNPTRNNQVSINSAHTTLNMKPRPIQRTHHRTLIQGIKRTNIKRPANRTLSTNLPLTRQLNPQRHNSTRPQRPLRRRHNHHPITERQSTTANRRRLIRTFSHLNSSHTHLNIRPTNHLTRRTLKRRLTRINLIRQNNALSTHVTISNGRFTSHRPQPPSRPQPTIIRPNTTTANRLRTVQINQVNTHSTFQRNRHSRFTSNMIIITQTFTIPQRTRPTSRHNHVLNSPSRHTDTHAHSPESSR